MIVSMLPAMAFVEDNNPSASDPAVAISAMENEPSEGGSGEQPLDEELKDEETPEGQPEGMGEPEQKVMMAALPPRQLRTSGTSLLIPFTKTWSGNAAIPDSITITLYKYLGTYSDTNRILVGTQTVSATMDWKCTFDIPVESLYEGSTYSEATAYKFKVVETPVAGYSETVHNDPEVIFYPPDIASSGWNKISPCSELEITTTGVSTSIVCVKKGHTCIVWSVDALSETERDLIIASAKAGIDGIGNPIFTFVSGLGTITEAGMTMTVTDNQISFSGSSDWSFFATGKYRKSYFSVNGASITNHCYTATGTLDLSGTKTVNGATPSDSQMFSFGLFEGASTTASQTAQNSGSGFSFETINYTLDDVGTKTYTVKETSTSGNGYTIDTAVYTVKVTVSDNGDGTLSVTPTFYKNGDVAEEISFDNTYEATGTLDLSGTKTVNGATPSDSQVFNFGLFEGTSTTASQTVQNSGSGFSFETINYTLDDVGTKTYTVKETSESGNGYTIDTAVYTVEVTISDKGDGTLSVTPTFYKDGEKAETIAFDNTYNPPAPDPEYGNLTVSKRVTNGGDTNRQFEFAFTFTPDGSYSYTGNSKTGTLKSGDRITLKHGEYITIILPAGTDYTVVEKAEANYTVKPGTTFYGKIVKNQEAKAAFENEYVPPVPDGNLTIKKTVTGDLAEYGKYFTFTIEFDAEGSYSYSGSKSGTIKSGGSILLKHNESVTISGLPAGTEYSVTESGNTGYKVYCTGDTGSILANRTVTAAFTNTKSKVPNTGDDTNLPLWLGITGLSGLGMLITSLFGTKRKRRPKHAK